MRPNEFILILDFGSQYTQLIARRIREAGVYSEIQPFNFPVDEIAKIKPKGIILSGGPASVYENGSPQVDVKLFQLGIPVLGICYGLQLIAYKLGGEVDRFAKREYGKAILKIEKDDDLFYDLNSEITVWMSHGDALVKAPPGFEVIAQTENSPICVIRNREKKIYGVQFHPEVVHTEKGFESWGIGGKMWADSNDEESIKALHRAIELGVNFIDTALVYGDGHSERLIGKVLKETRENVYVATKIPPKNMVWPALKGTPLREVFPYEHIIKSTEQSLKNLGVDAIDLQQFHVWNDEWARMDEWWEAIQKLKEEGKIRFFGVSINDHEPWNAIELIKTGRVDTVQVIYNIFDQSPEDELFPICMQYNIGVIVRVPFDEGSLTGKITPETKFPDGDWRNRYFRDDRKQQVWERVKKLEKLLGNEAQTLSELALRFCLSHEAVSTVIPGMRKVQHVEENVKVSDGRKLSQKMLFELRKHRWVRNFYR